MYTGAALSFGLIRACRGGLVLYCSVLSDAGGENDGSSAIFERSLLDILGHSYHRHRDTYPCGSCVAVFCGRLVPVRQLPLKRHCDNFKVPKYFQWNTDNYGLNVSRVNKIKNEKTNKQTNKKYPSILRNIFIDFPKVACNHQRFRV